MVHRKFLHHRVHITTNSIENTTIHLQMGDKEVRLSAVYKKPTTSLDTSDINKIQDSPLNTIIAGDLNAKNPIWNSKTTNPAGMELERFLDTRLDTTVAVTDTPTRYPDNPNHYPDILDIALMKTGNLIYHIENLEEELSSDHTPVLLDIQARSKQTPPPRPLRTINWEKIKEELGHKLLVNNLTSNKEQIDLVIKPLTETISKTLERNTTQFVPTDRKRETRETS